MKATESRGSLLSPSVPSREADAGRLPQELASWIPRPGDPGLRAAETAVRRALADLTEGPVHPTGQESAVAERIGDVDLSTAIGLEAAVTEAASLMRDGDLRSAHSRCFGYFNPTAAWPAVLADFLVAARNPQICVVSHARASAAMEREVIRFLIGCLGFPAAATGNFTSGGSEANATALLVALVRGSTSFAREGLHAYTARPCLYASADSHLAWIKIARAAGLGHNAVRLVPTDGNGRLCPTALEAQVQSDQATGWHPIMLAATVGTTNAGALDPVSECRRIADAYGMHLHVDAAWAGGLIVDPDRRRLLGGIESADSVTIDAHKWLSVPMGAGMIFVRDTAAVRQAFAVQTGYMPAGDGVDSYLTTSQWSRRFVGLRLWMMLRTSGVAGYQQQFARQFAAAAELRAALLDNGWTIHNDSPLPVVLFADSRHGIDAQKLADALELDGTAWLGRVDFEGQSLLRACVTSFLTEAQDIGTLLDTLNRVRANLCASGSGDSNRQALNHRAQQ